MIEIKDLAKIYNTEHGEFKAIENINLFMYVEPKNALPLTWNIII